MITSERAISIETMDEITIARFTWPGNRASAGLWVSEELDEFFERERKRPSKVVMFVAPPETVKAANLELSDSAEDEVGAQTLMHRMVRRENMMQRLIMAIRDAEAFVVGVVHGEVALRMTAPLLACDYRIASEDTTFLYTSDQLPVAPSGGALWFLNRLVGPARTVEMVVNGRPVPAREAQRLGFVNFVTSAGGVEAEALSQVQCLAALPPQTLHLLKRGMVNACEEITTFLSREKQLLSRETASMLHEGFR